MKKILALFLFVASFVTIQSQTPYDTVNVRDPQNFVEMTTVDTAYFQLIGRKANLNRRMSLTTLKNWILAGVDGIDTVYWSGDTLNILQGLTLWQAVADDNSGLFDASNNNDTIRVSTALLRAALTFTQGANAITFSGSGSNTIVVSNSSSVGVNASGGTFGGIFSSGSASGVGVRGSSAGASGVPIDAANSYTGTTNDERPGLRLRRSGIYTGAPGNGIYASFYSRYGYSGDAETARISGVSRDTSASGSGELNFYVRNAGTITKRGTIAGSGQLTLDGYANNALNNVDSSLYVLAVDATGDVHTRAASAFVPDSFVYATVYALEDTAANLRTALAPDGNGIYDGSGTVPDSTYAKAFTSADNFDYGLFIGYFPLFPDQSYRDRGLMISPYNQYIGIFNGDSLALGQNIYTGSGADKNSAGFSAVYNGINNNKGSNTYATPDSVVIKNSSLASGETFIKAEERRITIGKRTFTPTENMYFNVWASDTLNNGYIELFEKYRLANATPSTTAGDTTVMAWCGTGTSAEPIGFISKSAFGSPASSALSIYNLLPTQSVTIDPNNFDLQIGTAAANNTGEFEFYALTAESQDVTIYAGSRDSSTVTAGEGFFYDAFLSSFGAEDGIIGINYEYFGTVWNAAIFGDSVLIAPYPSSELAMTINGLPDDPSNGYKVMVQDTVTDRVYLTSIALSTSNDSLTISGGNSVRVPGNGFIRDSITSTTLTVDLAHHNNAVVVLKMESATNLTLTINNPWSAVSGSYPNQSGETGVYTFHFRGISGTDNVTWPANFYDMGGTALGTDALTAGTAYTCYYDPVATNYYCK